MAVDNPLVKLQNAYRQELDLEKRVEIATRIFEAITSDLRLYVFGKIHGTDAEDVLSETLKAIFTGLAKFRAFTDRQFYQWCYQIAKYKIIDQIRQKKKANDRFDPIPIEEMENIVAESAQRNPFARGERLDVQYAMALIAKAKPECHDLLWEHYFNDLVVSDLAINSKLDYHTVKRRIERCIKKLRALLAKFK